MYELLAWTIVIIAAVFIGLTVLIVVNKAWRDTNGAYYRRRRRFFEPGVLAYAHGETESLLPSFESLRGRDRGVLEETLIDHVQRVRGIEHQRLARALNELGFVDDHLRGLESRRWWRRARSAERLGLAGAKRAISALAAALDDEFTEVRLRAAKSLGVLGGPSSVRVLIRTLDEPSRWSTIRIADILTGMGRDVVHALLQAFPQMSANARLAALDILGRIRPLTAVPFLVEQLGSPQRDVRARACHALGCIGDPDTVAPLIEALSDKQWPVRAMAAKALGRIRDRRSIPHLSEALADRRWWVRSNAALALRDIGPAGLAALEEILDSDDRFARHQAVLMLQQTGEVNSRVSGLASDDAVQRAEAEEFVRRLAAARQAHYLRTLADEHEDPLVRARLTRLLAVKTEGAT